MSVSTHAYFAWRHYHPHLVEDPQAVWSAAWGAGGRAALQDSSRLVELVPLLRDLLASFQEQGVENELRAGDRRPPYDDWDECEVSW